MKKSFLILFTFITLFISNMFAQEMTYSKLRNGNGISVNLELKSYSVTSLSFRGEEMHEVVIPGIFIPNNEGEPNLPKISRFIAIPKGAEVRVSVKNMDVETLENINIVPALKIQPISEEPVTNYVKNNNIYSSDIYFPQNICEVSEVTELRGVNAVLIGISPFQFNPVTKKLKVIQNIDIEVEFVGGTKEYYDPKYRSLWFDPILKNTLLNYEELSDIEYKSKSSKDGDGCEYLIIIPNRSDFEPLAAQIKEFRTKQGIYTKVMRLDEMEVENSDQLKSYIHNAYNSWEIPPVAVLLMGDHSRSFSSGIPAEVVAHPDEGECITDNQYADINGDNLPDIVFSRMAAETEAQMKILVSKLFEYETQPCTLPTFYQNPLTALGWQTDRWFQVFAEVIGGYWRHNGRTPVRVNEIHNPPQNTSIWSNGTNTASVINYFGDNGLKYIPDSPDILGNWTGGNANKIINAINNGAFAVVHRDHGVENGWLEPDFKNSHISQLTNIGKMTYLFTINCKTGKFNHTAPCFGEVFQRHTFNGQNAGCVGFIAPTETSFSFVNDVFAWGMFDFFDPQFMPSFGPQGLYTESYSGNWMPSFGNVAGKYFLAQNNWASVPQYKVITYQMFTTHSDAFLRLFTEAPQNITVVHPNLAYCGVSDFWISANAGTLITLTAIIDENIEILDVAIATGELQAMTLPDYLKPKTEITVVCTGQNFLRHESNFQMVPSNSPYLMIDSYNLTENAEFGKKVGINFELNNVANSPYNASNVAIKVSTESQFVSVPELPLLLGDIDFKTVYTSENELFVTLSENVPNNELIVLNLLIICEYDNKEYEFESTVEFRAYAPALNISEIYVENLNSARIDVFSKNIGNYLVVEFFNNGNMDLHNINIAVSAMSEYLTVDKKTDFIEIIEKDGITKVKFLIYVGNASDKTPVSLTVRASSGAYSENLIYTNTIGALSDYYMANETNTTAWANFYDTGGPNNNYSPSESLRMTFFPSNSDKKLKISFSTFNVEDENDFLYIYNGTQALNSLLIATFTGAELPQDYVATNEQGALTVRFNSNATVQTAGWTAIIEEAKDYFNVSFYITDETNQPVTDAIIKFDSHILAKNQLNVPLVASGEYSYSVEKEGYNSELGTISVENANEQLTVQLTPAVSIDNTFLEDFYVYPNPFSDIIYIKGNLSLINKVYISNMLGQKVKEINLEGKSSFTTENLPKGIYMITFEKSNRKSETLKMIKK